MAKSFSAERTTRCENTYEHTCFEASEDVVQGFGVMSQCRCAIRKHCCFVTYFQMGAFFVKGDSKLMIFMLALAFGNS